MEKSLENYRGAIDRALAWASDRVLPNGQLRGSEDVTFGYYKAMLAFLLGGRPQELGRVRGHIRRTFYSDGAFSRGETSYPGASVGPAYREAWFIWGAHLSGAYDMSQPAIERFQRDHIDGETGGAYVAPGDPTIDLGLTCAAIATLLATGRLDAAIKAGRVAKQIVEAQSGSDRWILRWQPQKGRVSPSSYESPAGWIIDPQATNQVYWYPGITLYAFARLHMATGSREWLDAAAPVLRFLLACEPDFAGNMNTSKVAWGASQMYAATGEDGYRKLALSVADWMVESQDASGIWVRKKGQNREDQPLPVCFDATLDKVVYLSDVIIGLCYRD